MGHDVVHHLLSVIAHGPSQEQTLLQSLWWYPQHKTLFVEASMLQRQPYFRVIDVALRKTDLNVAQMLCTVGAHLGNGRKNGRCTHLFVTIMYGCSSVS